MKLHRFLLVLFPVLMQAQTWVNRTYSNLYDVQARAMVEMANGNFLVTGTQAFANGFLSVHEPTGACMNSYFLSQSALSSYSDFYVIENINDTLAVLGGRIELAGGPAEVWKGITLAVNQNGAMLWALSHEVSNPGVDAVVQDIERLNDSTFLVLSSSTGASQNALSKISKEGTVWWTINYDSNDDGFQLNDICVVDSTLFVCGNISNAGTYSGVLIKLDSTGNFLEGSKYIHSVQPDFVQIIRQSNKLVVANRGHAMLALDLLQTDFSGNVLNQKSYPLMMTFPEEQSTKPLEAIDTNHFWYWHGGNFGSFGYRIDGNTLIPNQAFSHMGNLQAIYHKDSCMNVLSTGPIYGVKNQSILQKHYAITSAETLDALYTFCSYSHSEPPFNELAPIKTSIFPILSSGNNPSVLFYPLLSNEPWNNEPFCVEMLGGMEEKALVLGPNPCDEALQIDGALNQNYRFINLEGACISSGKTNDSGRIDTQEIPNGIYFIILQKGVFRFQVFHGF